MYIFSDFHLHQLSIVRYEPPKDVNGWFHIDKDGQQLYKQRYSVIEPFYNGFALVTESGNNKQIIDESGCVVIDV